MHDATASTDPLASVHIEKHRDARREMKKHRDAHGSGEFVCAQRSQRSQRSLGQILAKVLCLALAKRSFRWIPPECGVVMCSHETGSSTKSSQEKSWVYNRKLSTRRPE